MLEELKKQVYEANMELPRRGLITYTWGNVSGIDRESGYFVIKPSGVDYDALSPDDMVVMDLDGNKIEGRYKPSSDTATHIELYKKYEERGGQPSFRAENAAAYAVLLETLYTLADSDNYVRDMQICEKLLALLTLLMQESWHPEAVRAGSAKRQNLQEIKDYLDAHYGEKITLDALAEQFYINKFYLTRVFKEQFGQTVTGYLMQLRITRAKRLLRFSDKNIEVIAQECGMSDANYFSRIFKKVEGTTPGQYRRQW